MPGQNANLAKGTAAKRAILNAATHCKHGHPWDIANTAMKKHPNGKVYRHCRKCQAERTAIWTRKGTLSRAKAEQIITALDEGKTVSQMHHGGIIKVTKFNAFIAANPLLGRRLLKRSDENRTAALRALGESRRVWAAPAAMRRDGHAMMEEINRVTAGVAESIRDEVRSRIALAVVEGQLKVSEIKTRYREFVSAHNRMFTQFVPVVGGVMRSLDMRLNEDNENTLHNQVTRGLWE